MTFSVLQCGVSTQTSSTQAREGQSAGRGPVKVRHLTVGGSQAQLLQGKMGTQVVVEHWGRRPTAAQWESAMDTRWQVRRLLCSTTVQYVMYTAFLVLDSSERCFAAAQVLCVRSAGER